MVKVIQTASYDELKKLAEEQPVNAKIIEQLKDTFKIESFRRREQINNISELLDYLERHDELSVYNVDPLQEIAEHCGNERLLHSFNNYVVPKEVTASNPVNQYRIERLALPNNVHFCMPIAILPTVQPNVPTLYTQLFSEVERLACAFNNVHICLPIETLTTAPPTAPSNAPPTAPSNAPLTAPTTAPPTATTTAPSTAPPIAPSNAPLTAPTTAPPTSTSTALSNAPLTAPTTAPPTATSTAPSTAPPKKARRKKVSLHTKEAKVYSMLMDLLDEYWRIFGTELQISEEDLDKIQLRYPRDLPSRVYALLQLFKNNKDNYYLDIPTKVRFICRALDVCNRNDLRRKVDRIMSL